MFRYNFFFQAEDGIRDSSVTGVQTCALPIFKDITAECARVHTIGSSGGALPAAVRYEPTVILLEVSSGQTVQSGAEHANRSAKAVHRDVSYVARRFHRAAVRSRGGRDPQ